MNRQHNFVAGYIDSEQDIAEWGFEDKKLWVKFQHVLGCDFDDYDFMFFIDDSGSDERVWFQAPSEETFYVKMSEDGDAWSNGRDFLDFVTAQVCDHGRSILDI